MVISCAQLVGNAWVEYIQVPHVNYVFYLLPEFSWGLGLYNNSPVPVPGTLPAAAYES